MGLFHCCVVCVYETWWQHRRLSTGGQQIGLQRRISRAMWRRRTGLCKQWRWLLPTVWQRRLEGKCDKPNWFSLPQERQTERPDIPRQVVVKPPDGLPPPSPFCVSFFPWDLFLSSTSRVLLPAPHAAPLFGGAEGQVFPPLCAQREGGGGHSESQLLPQATGNKEVGDSDKRKRRGGWRHVSSASKYREE